MKPGWYAVVDDFWGVRLFVSRQQGSNLYIATPPPMHFEKVESCQTPKDPTFRLARSEAQTLLQTLWDCGYRPSDGEGTGGHVNALKYHLEDMRRLVFNREEKE